MARWLAAMWVGVILVAAGCTNQPECKGTAQVCDGSCVEFRSDVENCGACNHACAPGEVCSAGSCALTCQAGLVTCGGRCVDPLTDWANCGASGSCVGALAGAACAAGEVCSAGSCQLSCQAGLTDCDGSCADVRRDNLNCGACGNACAAGEACSNGACALSCQVGLVNCGGKCVDPMTDRAFCGASGACDGASGGVVCATGEVCVAGACGANCPAGQVACGGRCVDPLFDPDYCGVGPACTGGNGCASGEACYQGMCHALCSSGQVMCDGNCIDPLASATHCGASGYCMGASAGAACLASERCEAGACVPNCTWQLIATHSLTTVPPGSMPAGGVDGGQAAGTIAGRTAWTTTSHWMTLLVPMGLSASDDIFAVEVDLFWPLYGSGSSLAGMYALIDHAAGPGTPFYLNSYGELHGVWSGWYRGAGFTVEWHGPPTILPAMGWRPELSGSTYSNRLSSGAASDPTRAWRTLRLEGRRSACRFRFIVDGVEQSAWAGSCDAAGSNLGLRAVNPIGASLSGIGWSNLRISRGSEGCGP